MSEISIKHKIALGLIPRIGDINARKLVSYFGSVEAIFHEPYRNLMKIPGIGSGIASYISRRSYLEVAENEAEYVEKNMIKVFFYLDDDYPFRLKQCDDSPVVFYFRGNCNLNSSRILSIVGTRSSTPRGRETCERIIGKLAEVHPGLIIVSGLAFGIDITAHRAALAHNLPTVGVLGHGFKTIYPALHSATAKSILNQGGLLTDFVSETLPERNNFIRRNRIIAGLSDATLVVESAVTGGALITADMAASYNRDVLAVPGRPGDQWSAGCNALIKTNKAALVESAEDIDIMLNWESEKAKNPVQKSLFPSGLNSDEQNIYNMIMKEGEATIDSICRSLNIPVHILSSTLLQMELRGIVKCYPGNLYRAG